MKRKGFFQTACTLTAALLLAAACSQNDFDDKQGEPLPEGKYPMTFATTVEGVTATRATTDNSWAGKEEVAVQVGTANPKKYTAATDGKLSAATGVEPFYWESTTKEKIVSAWYPYTATKPTSFSVKKDQSGTDGYQASDLIYAAPKEITYGNSSLTFEHLPVKVVVNLKNGGGVTATEVTNATVTIMNQATTSGAIATDWSVTQQTTQGNTSIAPNVLGTAASGYQKTVQALLVPQKSTTSMRFIKVTIGSQEFYYSTTPDFAAGQQHTYNITVLKSGITVTATGATAWTGTTSDVTSKEVTIFSASDLKIGDYYYSDGTWSDGGLRKRYVDGTFVKEDVKPVLTDASNQSRTVVGIVYWVGDVAQDDTKLKAKLGGDSYDGTAPHGLVVALHEAKQPSASTAAWMYWSTSYEQVNNWTNSDDRGANKVDITVVDKYQGYANTAALKAYNESSNVQNNSDLKVLPITAIEQYSKDYPAPTNSSGWYVPSIMELKYMCWGQGAASASTAGRELLNSQFDKADGTKFVSFRSEGYWSSSEDARYNQHAWGVAFINGNVGGGVKNLTNSDELWVRALFAF
ncbi:fimbrillin family protein [Bacteroides timonensis]|uniref:fimbrillin family protein n=1 Tax=Bacteroides timonensis TaxID=1470345 RepID=UPI0004BC7341|nr:fimbrillin family protein [Bacteroides timonensis]